MKKLKYILFTLCLMTITTPVLAARECCYCGTDALAIPAELPNFVATIVTIAQILVPVVLIVSAIIRYVKVVVVGEEKATSEINKSVFRSIAAAVIIFIAVSLVKFAFSVYDKANGSNDKAGRNACISAFINGCSNVKACEERATIQSEKEAQAKAEKEAQEKLKKEAEERLSKGANQSSSSKTTTEGGSTTHQTASGQTNGGGSGSWGDEGGSTTHQTSSGQTHGGGGGEW